MIIDCISDLHGFYPDDLPGGDLLIVAGDLTARDLENEYALFDYWLNKQKYSAKIVIAGNHDNFLQKSGCNSYGFGHRHLQFGTYLEDSGTEFNGLKIWGSPWTKAFEGMNPSCKAFTCDTEEELAVKFALIPEDTDILVTHCPPFSVLDDVKDHYSGKVIITGSPYLYNFSRHFQPKLHVFGHIHQRYGKKNIVFPQYGENYITFVNASHVNRRYEPVNKPIRIEL